MYLLYCSCTVRGREKMHLIGLQVEINGERIGLITSPRC